MRGLLKIFASIMLIVAIIWGIFYGKIFFQLNGLRKDLENLESYDFEVDYYVWNDDDVLNMEQYESEENPAVTQWLASYLKKMSLGGSVVGEMRNDVFHAQVYAKKEEQPSIEFYYDDKAVFGTQKTMNYIIDSVSGNTKLPVSILKNITPDGYLTLGQIQTILGASQSVDAANLLGTQLEQWNVKELASSLLGGLKLLIPRGELRQFGFEEALEDINMSYFVAKAKLNEQDVKMDVGISNDTYHKYVYVKVRDVNGRAGNEVQVLLHINVTENEEITVPEVISDEIVDTLASTIRFLNNFGK